MDRLFIENFYEALICLVVFPTVACVLGTVLFRLGKAILNWKPK